MDKSWRGVKDFVSFSVTRVSPPLHGPGFVLGFRVPWCYAPPPFLSKDFCFLTLMSITRLRRQVIEPWRSVPVRLNRPNKTAQTALSFYPWGFYAPIFTHEVFFAYAESWIFNLGGEWHRPSNIWVPIGKYRVGHVLSTLVRDVEYPEWISSSILCRVS